MRADHVNPEQDSRVKAEGAKHENILRFPLKHLARRAHDEATSRAENRGLTHYFGFFPGHVKSFALRMSRGAGKQQGSEQAQTYNFFHETPHLTSVTNLARASNASNPFDSCGYTALGYKHNLNPLFGGRRPTSLL